MDTGKKSMLQMLLCAVLWSIAGIFIKMIDMNAMGIAGIRSGFAAVTVFCYMKCRGERVVFSKNVWICALFLTATFFAFVSANKLTTAANAIVLQYTAPVFILMAGAVFFKEKFLKMDLCVVLVTLAGVALFFFDQLDGGRLAGNLLGLLSGLFMAGMFMSVRHCDKTERMSGMLMGQLLTALIGIPFAFAGDGQITGKSMLFLAILGIFQLGIPYILCALASEGCTPLACSLIGTAEPLLNPVWVALFDGEAPGMFALMGAGVVIAAITVWCILKDKTQKQAVHPEQIG